MTDLFIGSIIGLAFLASVVVGLPLLLIGLAIVVKKLPNRFAKFKTGFEAGLKYLITKD